VERGVLDRWVLWGLEAERANWQIVKRYVQRQKGNIGKVSDNSECFNPVNTPQLAVVSCIKSKEGTSEAVIRDLLAWRLI
jgi:hypothetical protein